MSCVYFSILLLYLPLILLFNMAKSPSRLSTILLRTVGFKNMSITSAPNYITIQSIAINNTKICFV